MRDCTVYDLPTDELIERVKEELLDRLRASLAIGSPSRLQIRESPRVLRYLPGGHFSWHSDRGRSGASRHRDFTISVQLVPCSYAGGDLQVETRDGIVSAPQQHGGIVAFASGLRHRISPVVAGERWSFLCWVRNSSNRRSADPVSRGRTTSRRN